MNLSLVGADAPLSFARTALHPSGNVPTSAVAAPSPSSLPNLPPRTTVRQVPRTYRCYRMPQGLRADTFESRHGAFAQKMAAYLKVDCLTPHRMGLAPGVVMCAYWHSTPRERRLSTYTAGKSGVVKFHPRLAAVVVFDWEQGVLLVSHPRKVDEARLPEALGALADEGCTPTVLEPLCFDLGALLRATPSFHHPNGVMAPWKAVQLKALSWVLPGREWHCHTESWSGDGWADYPTLAVAATPERIARATFRIVMEGRKAYALQLGAGDHSLKVALSAKLLPAVHQLLACVVPPQGASQGFALAQ